MTPLMLTADLPANIRDSEKNNYKKTRQKYLFTSAVCAPLFLGFVGTAIAALVIDGERGYGFASLMGMLSILPGLVWASARTSAVDRLSALQRISSVRTDAGFVDGPPEDKKTLNVADETSAELAAIYRDIALRNEYVAALYQKMRETAVIQGPGPFGPFAHEYLIKNVTPPEDVVEILYGMCVIARKARGVKSMIADCSGADMAVYLAFAKLLDANHSE